MLAWIDTYQNCACTKFTDQTSTGIKYRTMPMPLPVLIDYVPPHTRHVSTQSCLTTIYVCTIFGMLQWHVVSMSVMYSIDLCA
jgi:hypothetical protein